MRKIILWGLAALLVTPALVAAETTTKDAKTSKGEKPKALPGWVIIEEDVWVPFCLPVA